MLINPTHALTWVAILPITPGYYWFRNLNRYPPVEPHIELVRDWGDGPYIGNSALRGWIAMESGEWAGPILPPKE